MASSQSGVDWSKAPDQSDAETARLDRSGNRYAAWPDQTDAESARLGRSGNPYAYWPDQSDAETARLNRYEGSARAWANWNKGWGEYTAKQDAEALAKFRAGLPAEHRRADAYRRELDQQAADALRMSGGPRGGTGVAYGDAPLWNMRDASAAWRNRAPESTFSYGFNLGDRSVLDGVSVTLQERVGRAMGEFWAGTKSLAYSMSGARAMDSAVADWKAGNYVFSVLHGMESFGAAGTSMMGVGVGGVRTSATVMAFPGAEATAAARATYLGNVGVRIDEMGTFTAAGSEVFHAPAMTRIGSDAVSIRVSENVAPIKGVHDVVVHGIPYDESGAVFLVDNLPTNARQIAEAVKANPSWDGQPIRLLTCYGGCGPLSPAQELSTILNAPVQGATNAVGVARVPGSVPVVRNGGSWIDFLPQ